MNLPFCRQGGMDSGALVLVRPCWRGREGSVGKPTDTSWALAAQNVELLGAPAAPQVGPLNSLLQAFKTARGAHW